jgi:hypothetical protein
LESAGSWTRKTLRYFLKSTPKKSRSYQHKPQLAQVGVSAWCCACLSTKVLIITILLHLLPDILYAYVDILAGTRGNAASQPSAQAGIRGTSGPAQKRKKIDFNAFVKEVGISS